MKKNIHAPYKTTLDAIDELIKLYNLKPIELDKRISFSNLYNSSNNNLIGFYEYKDILITFFTRFNYVLSKYIDGELKHCICKDMQYFRPDIRYDEMILSFEENLISEKNFIKIL